MIIRLIKNQVLLLPPTTTTTTTTSMISNSSSRKQTHITKRLLSSTTPTTTTTSAIITSSSNDKSWNEIASSYFNSYSSSGGVCTNNRESSTSNNNNNQEMVSSASTTSSASETLQQDNNNNNEKKKKRKQLLAVMIESAVRKRLKKQFPNEFDIENSTTTSTSSSLSSLVSFQTLLTLNGYQRIVIPTGNNASRLYLAEGVVVTPRPPTASSNYYSEFAKRFSSNNSTMRPKERLYVQLQQPHQQQHELLQQLSNFVQEDITLYRIIENSAAQFLDRRYISMKGFFDRRFIRPFTDVKYRTRIFIKTVHSIQQKFQNMVSPSEKSLIVLLIEKIGSNNKRFPANSSSSTSPSTSPSTSSSSSLSLLDDTTTNFKSIPDDDVVVVVDPVMLVSSSSATPPLSSLLDEEEKEKEPLETLIVISSRPSNDINNNENNDEIILSATIYNYMTPSTRLLALGTKYYLLKHSSASTLVSCSLVLFGALPLSYRSYIFSVQYSELLSSTSYIMAMSVVGTISYGILSSRWKAQTSQSYIISNALCERIYSRNESSYYLLQQNAIQYITKSILLLYHGNNENEYNNFICYDADDDNSSSNNNNNHNHNKDVLVNPIEWAIDFGLLMKQEQDQEHEQEQQYYYKAIPLEDALKCMKMHKNMNKNMNTDS